MTRWSLAAVGGVFLRVLLLLPRPAAAQAIQMLGVFEQRCGTCHTKPAADSRAPDRDSLRQRTPEAILDALTTGSMKVNAEGLTDRQKQLIAEFITERPLGSALAGQASAMPNRCAPKPLGDRDGRTVVEWLGRGRRKFPVSTGSGIIRGASSKAGAEMGIRVSERHLRVRAADDRWRPRLRRLRQRIRLRA